MRRSRFVTGVAVACVLSVVVLPGSPALVAAPMFSETVVAGGSGIGIAPTQTNPEMDGRYIVYDYTPGFVLGVADSDIKAYDLQTGETIDVSDPVDNDTDQILPDVSMDTIVYQSQGIADWNIFLYNIPWDNTIQITNELSHAQTTPRISGGYVIWHDAQTDALKYWSLHWPQHSAPRLIPGTVGVYDGSWDIDGDTVVFALQEANGDFTFYKWTVEETLVAPRKFDTLTSAVVQIADVRLHHDTVTYTYGGGLDRLAVISLRGVRFRPFFMHARDGDVFHGSMYAYESVSEGGIGVVHDGLWSTTLGVGGAAESNPSVFGNRVAFERDVNNGDIILGRSSEPLVDRTSGADRYATAVAVSQEYFRTGADNVVLCTGENFPDALAAAPWARYLKAPVLLTRRTSLPGVVMDEIERLGAVNVWIVGGQSAVSSAVHAQLLGAGLDVSRELQGSDRYETSAKIATLLHNAVTAGGRPLDKAFVVRGDAFPDALAVAPVAAAIYSPIVLVRSNAPLPSASENVFKSLHIKHAFIVGGTDVIDEEVELAIEELTTANLGSTSPAVRWAGSDRYATSVEVVRNAVAMNWVDLDTLGFATGANFPDALGGGAALGTYGSPLLLTRGTSLPTSVSDRVTYHRWEIGRADIFGGASVVSDGVRDTIAGLIP
ncbi:MAG: cell wall-binding repeat-containing protein [Coriobacteriia bacterium]|nr:cell wall-binding repeat-containing protein [Coriobacteriia bacterium]